MGSEVLFGPADRFARDVLATVLRHPVDALLVDVAQFGSLIGAERSGLPTIGLLPSIYVRPTRGHPIMGTGWLPARGPIGKARDIVVPSLVQRLVRLGLPRLNAVRTELGLSPMTDVFDLWDSVRGCW